MSRLPATQVSEPVDAVELGISYLRVSSKRQMDTAADVDPDGNSIATQREYCQSKAKNMKVMLDKEFVEPGTSAQSIDKRPIFRQLLAYLTEHPEVKYVFIYMRSRAFRNFTDAAITKRQLSKMGVKLVSAKEDFGEGIMADAMEAVTDIMNEVQVRLSGQDIATKMANKARNGGTISKAKLGYENSRVEIDGRKVNTITVDDERARYVVMAFELMASGSYKNVEDVQAALTDAGLRMPKTGRPISKQIVFRMLRDRYYLGFVNYKGIEYKGRHQPLISEELFNRVQRILDSHSGSGVRRRTHHHYLKGLLWCERCRARFILQRAEGRLGGEYFYFFCRGRQNHVCDHPFVPVEAMEQAVEQHYATIKLDDDFIAAVRAGVDEAADSHCELDAQLRGQFSKRLEVLDSKENYLLDLAAEEGWPKDKLRSKIAAIRTERTTITDRLDHSNRQLETGRDLLHQALDLLSNLQVMYRTGNETVRSILNRAVFTKLYADGRKVSEHELSQPFDVLHGAHQRHRAQQHDRPANHTYHRHSGALVPTQRPASATDNRSPLTMEGASEETLIDSLVLALRGQGWSKAVMVEVLAAYSHSAQATDLRLCHTVALTSPMCAPRPSAKRPWSLHDRLDERDITDLITAYREGATAASLAAAHSLSLSSVKRLLNTAGVRRTSSSRRTTKATPTVTHP